MQIRVFAKYLFELTYHFSYVRGRDIQLVTGLPYVHLYQCMRRPCEIMYAVILPALHLYHVGLIGFYGAAVRSQHIFRGCPGNRIFSQQVHIRSEILDLGLPLRFGFHEIIQIQEFLIMRPTNISVFPCQARVVRIQICS